MPTVELPKPEFINGSEMHIVGIRERYPFSDCSGIPGQWARFQTFLQALPEPSDGVTYGVFTASDTPQELDYCAGIETTPSATVPEGLTVCVVPAQRYAVFAIQEPISTIQSVIQRIWNDWLPASGCAFGNGPTVERYDAAFDPNTGNGGYQIWFPIAL